MSNVHVNAFLGLENSVTRESTAVTCHGYMSLRRSCAPILSPRITSLPLVSQPI